MIRTQHFGQQRKGDSDARHPGNPDFVLVQGRRLAGSQDTGTGNLATRRTRGSRKDASTSANASKTGITCRSGRLINTITQTITFWLGELSDGEFSFWREQVPPKCQSNTDSVLLSYYSYSFLPFDEY